MHPYQIAGTTVRGFTTDDTVNTLAVLNDASGRTAQYVRFSLGSVAGLFSVDTGEGVPTAATMAFIGGHSPEIVFTGGSPSIYFARITGGTDILISATPVEPRI